MTNTSLDISGKIDEETVRALARVMAAADSMGISFFIIGALARDILLKLYYGGGFEEEFMKEQGQPAIS
jgi:hypothetical protein